MSAWKARRITGFPSITQTMLSIMQHLRAALRVDWPFIPLPEVHPHTIRALVEREWIFASPGEDGARYKITARGLRALSVYERPAKRYDGICPNCNTRPKHVYASGRKVGYCIECECLHRKRQRDLKRANGRVDRPCSRCKKRPRHQHPGGTYSTYCTHCRQVTHRRHKRRARKQQLKQVKKGVVILCSKCHEKPRHHTENTVCDWCVDCQRDYMNAYNDRRRPGSKPSRERKRRSLSAQ